MDDLISRQAVLDAFDCSVGGVPVEVVKYVSEYANRMMSRIKALPSAQPELAIPLQWIEAQIEWLKSLGNGFSTLAAGQISAMVDKWKEEQDG